jgi:hypothetical protein
MTSKRKRPKTRPKKKKSRRFVTREERKDLHTMVLEAEGAIVLKKRKRKG